MKTKLCTHCGAITHPQPQDPNHDLGYGHCYDCLNRFYLLHSYPFVHKTVNVYHELTYGRITEDDSHAKVIEVIKEGKITKHMTVYFRIDVWELDAL